jgi:hypothetical protein
VPVHPSVQVCVRHERGVISQKLILFFTFKILPFYSYYIKDICELQLFGQDRMLALGRLIYFLFASSSDLIPNRTNLATLIAISIVMSNGIKKKGI